MDVPILWNFVITSFALMNPLGMVPLSLIFTAGERKEVQRLVALVVAITVLAVLLVFMFMGTPILNFFGISLDSFRIAGGILLLGIGINIDNGVKVNPSRTLINKGCGTGNWAQARSFYQQIVIPMAMPLLLSLAVLLIFWPGKWLQSVLGDVGMSFLQRVMGLFVAVMGVQFILTGSINTILKQLVPMFR